MSILIKGKDFGPTEQVTSTKLDELVDNASFTDDNENSVAYTGTTGTCLLGGGLEVTSLGQLQIADSGVNTNEISDGAVTNAKIADLDVSTSKITNLAVITGKIGNNAVTQAKIANDAVGANQLASSAVVTDSIVNLNVTTDKIANDAITTAKIADDVELGGNPTTTTQAAADNSTRIATTSYVTSGIANALTGSGGIFGTIDQTADSNPKIFSKNSSGEYDSVAPSGDVSMTQAGAFTIAGSAVTTSKIADANVTTAKIADDAITFAKLADATLTSIKESLYPTGSLLTTTVNYADSAAVVAAYGGTTWVRFGEGQVLVGHSTTDSDFNAATPTTGGSKTHTLTTTEIPPHYHTYGDDQRVQVGTDNGTAKDAINDGDFNTGDGNIGENGDGTGNAAPHNNLQPYITVYMWKRTV